MKTAIKSELMGHIIDAVAKADSDAEYMELVLSAYADAYGIEKVEKQDEETVREIFDRLNAFQNLKADKLFETIFVAQGNLLFGDIAECVAKADYTIDVDGIASFDHEEIINMFLEMQRRKAN